MRTLARYTFDEVLAALDSEWGLSLHHGGSMGAGEYDGHWDSCYSKTGFVGGGDMPRKGLSYRHYRTLVDVVSSWNWGVSIKHARARRGAA